MLSKAVAALFAGVLLTPFTCVRAQTPLNSDDLAISSERQNGTKVPNTYIVRLKSTEAGIDKRSLQPQKEFHRLSQQAEVSYTTRETYTDSTLFVGLSLTLDKDDDIQALKDMDNVLGVWPVVTIPRPAAAISMSNVHERYV